MNSTTPAAAHPLQIRPIAEVGGRGVVLRGNDIDTDQILPSRFLKVITFNGMEAHVFRDARDAAQARGAPHPLDDSRYRGANILVVNRNFGCGSSREHAPQGLHRFGIDAIIGESFGEIFAGNCVAVGMPCVTASAETVAALQALIEANPETPLSLDLDRLAVYATPAAAATAAATTSTSTQIAFPITLSNGRQRQFLDGTWDPIAVLLQASDAIDAKIGALSEITA